MKEINVISARLGPQSILVDDEDFESLSKYRWYINEMGTKHNLYAMTKINYRHVSMHRMIMGNCNGLVIDHKDGNGLNNQKSNLRRCTKRQNQLNSRAYGKSGLKGVRLHSSGKYEASIMINGKREYLGSTFLNAESAAKAYNTRAEYLHGEFAKLNIIKSDACGETVISS